MHETQTLGAYRFAIATSCATIVLLMAGALVTNNNAGDSVPDWPLAYGRLVPPLVGGIRFEYAHRVIASVVAVLTLALAIWIRRTSSSRLARRFGWAALGLIVVQAALGGMRVLLGHPALIATAHATLAQLFFVAVVALSLFTSSWWQQARSALDDSSPPGLRALAAWTTLAVFVQLIVGAGYRHGAFGIMPHVVGAVLVTFLVIWTGRATKKRFGNVRDLRRWGIWLQAFLGTQILLGIGAYWATFKATFEAQPATIYFVLTVAHVLVGALTLASSVLLTLSSFRMIRPGELAEFGSRVESSAQGSRA
jgi:heme a synthase